MDKTHTLHERLIALATEARAKGHMIGVLDARYMTVGHPTEIGEDYIYFAEPWELDSTGKLGGKDAVGEKGLPKILLFGGIIHIEIFPALKG